MKGWAFLAGALLAIGVAGVIVSVAVGRRSALVDEDIPELLDDCADRIRSIESQLSLLRPDREYA